MKRGLIITVLAGILTLGLAAPALAQGPPSLPNPPFDQEKCLEVGTKGAPFSWDGNVLTGTCMVSPSRR